MKKIMLYTDRHGDFFSKCGWKVARNPEALGTEWVFTRPDGSIAGRYPSLCEFEDDEIEFNPNTNYWVKFGPQHCPAGTIIETYRWGNLHTTEVTGVYKTEYGYWKVETTDNETIDVGQINKIIKRGQGGMRYAEADHAYNDTSASLPTQAEFQALGEQLKRETVTARYLDVLVVLAYWWLVPDYATENQYDTAKLRSFITKHTRCFNNLQVSKPEHRSLTKHQLKRLKVAVIKNRNRLSSNTKYPDLDNYWYEDLKNEYR